MASLNVRDLGDFIRDQRRSAEISLRQLARQAGVSNPYLSQIERGLRKPSAEILQQIAKALRISAEVLYVQAGFLDEREGEGDVVDAVMRDKTLTERQRQVVLDIYESFRGENADPTGASGTPRPAAAESAAPKAAARPSAAATTGAPRRATPKTAAPKSPGPKSPAAKVAASKASAPKTSATGTPAPNGGA